MRCTAFSPSEIPKSNDAFVTGSFWKSSIVNHGCSTTTRKVVDAGSIAAAVVFSA
jgi:hypothetical protein